MKRTCGDCTHLTERARKGKGRLSYPVYCWLSGMNTYPEMTGCAFHESLADVVAQEQAQDEKWRPGASVPLAVPE